MSAHAQQIARATNWLLHSGIQNTEGGVARFYRSDRETNNPVSTEITGYHVSTLAWLFEAIGSQELLQRTVLTANFLVDCCWNPELQTFPFEYPHASPAYFFDCGIIVRGLRAAFRVTRKARYLEIADACAAQMAKDFDSGFDFHPILELPSKTATVREPRWSRSSGCYQLKSALAFQELRPEQWDRTLRQSLDQHDQFLPGHTDEERVMDRLHAYCYFLEALLISGRQEGIALGVQRMAYLLHRIAPVFARSDVYAQLLRVRIYAEAAGLLPLDMHTAALEAEQLAGFQMASADPRIDGGFCFGSKHGELLPYVNPVSTDFAIQALHLWQARQTGAALLPVSDLV